MEKMADYVAAEMADYATLIRPTALIDLVLGGKHAVFVEYEEAVVDNVKFATGPLLGHKRISSFLFFGESERFEIKHVKGETCIGSSVTCDNASNLWMG